MNGEIERVVGEIFHFIFCAPNRNVHSAFFPASERVCVYVSALFDDTKSTIQTRNRLPLLLDALWLLNERTTSDISMHGRNVQKNSFIRFILRTLFFPFSLRALTMALAISWAK